MITLDYALRIFTDKLNAGEGESIDITFFRSNLSEADFKEFQELASFVILVKSAFAFGRCGDDE